MVLRITHLTPSLLLLAGAACSSGNTPAEPKRDAAPSVGLTHLVDGTTHKVGTLRDVFIVPEQSVAGGTVSWGIEIPLEREVHLCRAPSLSAASSLTLRTRDVSVELPLEPGKADFVDGEGRLCNRATLPAGMYQASLSYPNPSTGGAVFVSSHHPPLRQDRLESRWLAATGKHYATARAASSGTAPVCTSLGLLVNLTTNYKPAASGKSAAWASGFFLIGKPSGPLPGTNWALAFNAPVSADNVGQFVSVFGCDDGGLALMMTDKTGKAPASRQHPEYGAFITNVPNQYSGVCAIGGLCDWGTSTQKSCMEHYAPAGTTLAPSYGFYGDPVEAAGTTARSRMIVYPSWPGPDSIRLSLGKAETDSILQAVSTQKLGCGCVQAPHLVLSSVAPGAAAAAGQECAGIFNDLVLSDVTATKIVVAEDGCSNCVLTGVDFPAAGVTHFADGMFQGSTLSSVNFSNVTFGCGKFTGASFADVQFSSATFLAGQQVAEAATSHAVDPCSDFSGVTGTEANFTEASLPNAVFSSADLSEADFGGADLSSATFASATLMEAKFSGAYLENSTFTDLVIGGGEFDGAIMWGATLSGDFPSDATAKLVSFRDVVFLGAKLAGANFEYADLTSAVFNSVHWTPVCLPNAATQRDCSGGTCTCSNQVESPLTAAGAVSVGTRSNCPDGTSRPGGCGPVLSTAGGCSATTTCSSGDSSGSCAALTYCNAPPWVPKTDTLANQCVSLTCSGQPPPPLGPSDKSLGVYR